MLLTDNEITLVFFILMVLCLAMYAGLGWLVTLRKRNAFVRKFMGIESDTLFMEQAKRNRARIQAEYDAFMRS